MSTISVCLIERTAQNFFSRSSRLVVTVISTMFEGNKRFRRCLFLFNLRYKQTVLKAKLQAELYRSIPTLMNLIEKNHEINMASDYSVSTNNSFKSLLNAKSFNMFLRL